MSTRYRSLRFGNRRLLAAYEVHTWFLDLRLDAEALLELRRTLSTDEEARVQQFRFQRDKDRSIASRGLLRALLAHYIDCEPRAVSFSYGSAGKPALTPGCAAEGIHFNVAHSGDFGLVAITKHREVGVDIEHAERQSDNEKVARRFFSPVELASFLESPSDERADAFVRHWVRKEAYLKARGFGLTRHEEGFDAALSEANVSTFVHADGTSWTAREVVPRAGYRASVVAQETDWHLRSFDWTSD
jgi:4'-phosphopantetheinyl transferase